MHTTHFDSDEGDTYMVFIHLGDEFLFWLAVVVIFVALEMQSTIDCLANNSNASARRISLLNEI